MAWYENAIFYHIYPLGLTGAPKHNTNKGVEHRLNTLIPWISHIREIGCNALYIGPLFESLGHGYETFDYKKVDRRLGTNEDLKRFVALCHEQGIRVILDSVFNHTGREFFAFRDIAKNREESRYIDWYRQVDFQGDNAYGDGFSYENWFGYDFMPILNSANPEVADYFCGVIRFWIQEFDVDGLRIDAAHALNQDFLRAIRAAAGEVRPDFWLMGEVIHGDYSRWVDEQLLHSVTNYQLHAALYCGHNDHNYYEISDTVKRLYYVGKSPAEGYMLYNFVDNHDEERIYTKLSNKANFLPVHILLYTLPGIPSLYYGSEFGIDGVKYPGCDDSLRPAIALENYRNALTENPCTALIAELADVRKNHRALSRGDYRELYVTERQYAFSRTCGEETVFVTVNNDESESWMTIYTYAPGIYRGALSGDRVVVPEDGVVTVKVGANSGEIWIPESIGEQVCPAAVA